MDHTLTVFSSVFLGIGGFGYIVGSLFGDDEVRGLGTVILICTMVFMLIAAGVS